MLVFWLTAMLCGMPAVQAADDFPGREVFPDVQIMELHQLYQRLNDVVVVDARTGYEFQTLHIKNALNIPLNSKFGKRVMALREKTSKPIVFYCNGHTCYKSYKAVHKAMYHKVDKVYAFDAGIFDWTNAHPEHAVLLGETPVKIDRLISKQSFKSRLIEPAEFRSQVKQSIVLDVRTRSQRAAAGLFPFQEQWVSLEKTKLLDKYIAQAKRTGKTLLVYDTVGKQVRWFQYYLEKKGLKNYFFMKGGADGYYKLLGKELAAITQSN
jgi:rhodanese-related sulfurtransferase